MDGKYLASNLEPLKSIGDGNVFIKINDLLNTRRFENINLVAYSIIGTERNIVSIYCLFYWEDNYSLYFREFDFFKSIGNVDDRLLSNAKHGIGFGDFNLDDFIKLRDFYFENKGLNPNAFIYKSSNDKRRGKTMVSLG